MSGTPSLDRQVWIAKVLDDTVGSLEPHEEGGVIDWVARALLTCAGVVTGWFVAMDAPNFSVIQLGVALLLLTLFVGVLAFRPLRWLVKRHRLNEPKP